MAQPGVRANKTPSVKMIYPSKSDVLGSYDGLAGGGCLPYAKKTHEKQKWLEKYLHHWRALGTDRNKAMPHIKVKMLTMIIDMNYSILSFLPSFFFHKFSHTRE